MNNTADRTYNGWTNYETWLAKLWIDNEQGDQDRWWSAAMEIRGECEDGEAGDRECKCRLAKEMEESFQDAALDLVGVTGFWTDLMRGALESVNWREVAEHIMEDADQVHGDPEDT
jgi:hypothetical protein